MVINHYNDYRIYVEFAQKYGKFIKPDVDSFLWQSGPMPKSSLVGELDILMDDKDVFEFTLKFFMDNYRSAVQKNAPSPEEYEKRLRHIQEFIEERLNFEFRRQGFLRTDVSDYSDSIYNIHRFVEPVMEDTLAVFASDLEGSVHEQ